MQSENLLSNLKSSFQKRFGKEPLKGRLAEEEVISLARKYCTERGGILRDPVNASLQKDEKTGELIWKVCDLVGYRGGNFFLDISDSTGEVLKTSHHAW